VVFLLSIWHPSKRLFYLKPWHTFFSGIPLIWFDWQHNIVLSSLALKVS